MSNSLKDLTLYHIFIYFGTFMVYASLHGLRAGWSYSKTSTQAQFGVTKDFLGIVDALYLASYTAGFAIMGSLIHRFSLKSYVVIGLTLSSLSYMIWIVIYAITGFYNQVMMVILMMISGFFQASGWPGIVAIFNAWFVGQKKGVLMGLWACNSNVGNILAESVLNLLDSYQVYFIWNFVVTGGLGLFIALLLLLFLKQKPLDQDMEVSFLAPMTVEVRVSQQYRKSRESQDNIKASLKHQDHLGQNNDNRASIKQEQNLQQPNQQVTQDQLEQPANQTAFKYGIFSVLCIPRVPSYALAYACLKGCIYGLLFWLPSLLDEIQGAVAEQKGYISAMIDVGALFGVLIIGFLTDKFNTNTLFLSPFLLCSSIVMFITAFALEDEPWTYYLTIFLVGAFVSGPYKLIGTVITLDISSQIKQKGSITKVSSLIEGSAAVCAMIEMIVIPYLDTSGVFYIFTGEMIVATLLMLPMFIEEVKKMGKQKINDQV